MFFFIPVVQNWLPPKRPVDLFAKTVTTCARISTETNYFLQESYSLVVLRSMEKGALKKRKLASTSSKNNSEGSEHIEVQKGLLLGSLSTKELVYEMCTVMDQYPSVLNHLRETYGHRVQAFQNQKLKMSKPHDNGEYSDIDTASSSSDIDVSVIDQYHTDCKDWSDRLNAEELFLQDHCNFPFSAILKNGNIPVFVERTCGTDDGLQSILIRVKEKLSQQVYTCPISDIFIDESNGLDKRSKRRRRNAKILRLIYKP